MAGILGIATSSLNAFQRALDVTANNIANVRNRAYNRQVVQFAQGPTQLFAGSYVGSGVVISDIHRYNDAYATRQVRDMNTMQNQYDTFYQQAYQVDRLLSQDGTSVAKSLQGFFSALSQLNDAPENISSRGVFYNQSQLLENQFKAIQGRLDEYQLSNNFAIETAVDQMNQITNNIALMNAQLMVNPGAPELLDARDEMLRQLAGYTNVTVVDQGDNTVSVSLGSGETVVLGGQSFTLSSSNGGGPNGSSKVFIESNAGAKVDITSSVHSGMLGGYYDYQANVLTPASQTLGKMAIGLASVFNAQHRLGMDLNDQIGKNFFTDYNQSQLEISRVMPANANQGTGALSVAITDISKLQASDYQFIVSNTASNEVRVIRQSDGQVTTLHWSSSPPAPPAGSVTLDGMTINVDNIAHLANNDQFTLSPTKNAAGSFHLELSDPRSIAFASPVRTEALLSNTGTGAIKLGTLLNTNAVHNQYQIQFISPTQYKLVDETSSVTTGPFTFTPNSDNTVMIPNATNPSYSVILSGDPAAGDKFNAGFNNGGYADNKNGALLGQLQQSKLFDDGTENIFDVYSNLVSSVGSKTYEAKITSEASETLYKQAVDYRDSISGVNLDEEAANILRFEQAYKAAGQLLTVANQLINVLFAAIG